MTTKHIEAFWENATADDVARVMAGETVEARFRDSETQPWGDCFTLIGWVNERRHQWRSAEGGGRWNHCQVYREPSWYADKPDPKPGFRLLEKFPDEPKLSTDEYWSGEGWMPAGSRDSDQHEQVWYRRRVEAVEPKFAVGQTVRVVGPKCDNSVFRHWSIDMEKHVGKTSTIKVREKKDADWFYEISDSVVWSFREDYLEAVEPEPKHYVLRVGDSVETPSGNRTVVMPQGGVQRFLNVKAGDTIKTIYGQTITITAKGFEVTQ
jgi:hypothetical protein